MFDKLDMQKDLMEKQKNLTTEQQRIQQQLNEPILPHENASSARLQSPLKPSLTQEKEALFTTESKYKRKLRSNNTHPHKKMNLTRSDCSDITIKEISDEKIPEGKCTFTGLHL
jgi:hypothetical protein